MTAPRSTRRPGTRRLAACISAFAVLVAACGQHPGVHVEATPMASDAPAVGASSDGVGDGVDTDVAGWTETDDLALDTDVELDPDGADAGAEQTDDTAAGPQARPQTRATPEQRSGGSERPSGEAAPRAPRGSDRTGVTDTTLTIAMHAPITGAAPLPSTGFDRARDLYWRWLTEVKEERVLGRQKVEVLFADDRFDPPTAVQVCRQLSSRAFMLIGAAGMDSIVACGRFAGQARIPYVSSGVAEDGLDGNPWYFAASMSYIQQAPLLAQYIRKHHAGQKVGGILMSTGTITDAEPAWEASLDGIDYHGTLRHPKGNTSWYSSYVRELGQAGVEVVFFASSPLDYIRFAQVADDQGYDFQYVGVGATMGINAILRSGCPQVDRGMFFSPVPALELADQLDPDFRRAAAHFGIEADDVAWALWGSAKFLHGMFERYEAVYGTDLTREDFRDVVASAGRVRTGIFPDVVYGPDRNLGGTGVHVLKADCSTGTYRDGGTFKTGF